MSDPIRLRDASGRTLLIKAEPDLTLAQVMFLQGLWPKRAFCAGLGRCGLCAVRYAGSVPEVLAEDRAVLSEAHVAQGWRLACRRQAAAGLDVELPFDFPATQAQATLSPKTRETRGALNLAVDLGTTSLHWRLDDELGTLDQGQDLNPQLPAGSEVMSRLGFALQCPDNARALRDVVLQWLQPLVEARPGFVDRISVAGNTVMTALLLGWPLQGLAAAPYTVPHPGGLWVPLAPGWPKAYIPPLPAPFIGGDLSAGLSHVHFSGKGALEYPFLLADMGTNGEFILALGPDSYLAASVPLGPALEGIGMTHGSAAVPGVWADFRLSASGLSPVVLSGETSEALMPGPRISGTGYLSLVALLRALGLLDESGRFAAGNTPLARRLGQAMEETATGKRLALGQDVFLTGRDVEELLKVKAAFNLAFSRLLAEPGLEHSALKAVYLAGALGEHVRPEFMEELGFVPMGMKNRIHALGNTSLAGAALLARSPRARDWIETVAPRMHVLALGQEQDFLTQFVQRLVFDHVP